MARVWVPRQLLKRCWGANGSFSQSARKGADRVGEDESFSSRGEGQPCAALAGHRSHHAEEVLGSPRTYTTAQGIALRRMVPLNVQTRPEEWLPQNGSTPVEHQVDHRGILLDKSETTPLLPRRAAECPWGFPHVWKKKRCINSKKTTAKMLINILHKHCIMQLLKLIFY